MRGVPAKFIAVVAAALAVSGTGIAAASVSPSASASHRGTERFTFMLSSATGVGSVIATGLFTDGGTMNIFSEGPSGEMKLGAGTIRLSTAPSRASFRSKTNFATCLTTWSERGSYKLSGGTGRYAGIRGSGRFTITDRIVQRHKQGGGCGFSRSPLAVQAIFTLTGSATLHG
jgi:hypothetical protein